MKNINQGTPKTLIEAINNALSEVSDDNNHRMDKIIEEHVIDYLNQKLAVAYLKTADAHALEILQNLKRSI